MKPQEDFYNYVNNKWLKNNPIPNKYSVWGTFHVLRDKNLKRLKKLISNKTYGKYKKLDVLYNEFMNKNKIKKLDKKPLKKYINKIFKCKTKDNLWKLLVEYDKFCFNPFFGFYPEIDSKNSKLVVLNLETRGLGLPARSYYFDKEKKTTRKEYKKYIHKLLNLYFKNNKYYDKIFEFEKELAKHTYTKLQMREPELNYNKMTIKELKKISKLNWDHFHSKFPYLIVDNPSFFIEFENVLLNG